MKERAHGVRQRESRSSASVLRRRDVADVTEGRMLCSLCIMGYDGLSHEDVNT